MDWWKIGWSNYLKLTLGKMILIKAMLIIYKQLEFFLTFYFFHQPVHVICTWETLTYLLLMSDCQQFNICLNINNSVSHKWYSHFKVLVHMHSLIRLQTMLCLVTFGIGCRTIWHAMLFWFTKTQGKLHFKI